MKFRITYTDPKTNEEVVEEKDFESSENLGALYWAEDYAYLVADKGHYEIEEVTNE